MQKSRAPKRNSKAKAQDANLKFKGLSGFNSMPSVLYLLSYLYT